jgi:hypothetical protein
MSLRRFWFRFAVTAAALPPALRTGCGVTAYDYDDAVTLISTNVFGGAALPAVEDVTEDVDVSQLDPGHVLPNMLPPSTRGIWFPIGYQ